jgi:hypothetical protein
MRKILTALTLVLGLIGLTAAVTPVASASVARSQATTSSATASSATANSVRLFAQRMHMTGHLFIQQMHITGFNAAIAKAHGYEILKNSKGQEYSVKIGSRTTFSPASNPVVTGNCGSSYMYFKAIGHRSQSPRYGASYDSGYFVIHPTLAGEWYMYFVDRDGVGDINNYNATNGSSGWSQSGTTWHTPTGYAYGEVSTSSYVIMDDGGYCVSGGPWESTNLY